MDRLPALSYQEVTMPGPGGDMAGPVREVLATADGLRVQMVTIEAGQRIP